LNCDHSLNLSMVFSLFRNHSSVVITVFKSGILDFSGFLLMMTWSLTSQGEMSSRLPSARWLELLLMMLEL